MGVTESTDEADEQRSAYSFRAKPYRDAMGEATPPSSLKDKQRRIRAANNRMEVFFRSENEAIDYPCRLVTPDSVGPRIRAVTETLLIDSNIGNGDTTNRDVLEAAVEYDAQYIVPKDYLADRYTGPDAAEQAMDATYESAREFEELWLEYGCPGTVIWPLQPPHHEHYTRYRDFYQSKSHLGLGGVRDADVTQQIEAVHQLRDIVGPHRELHGFGFGCSEAHLKEAWSTDPYLDSMDVATFEMLPKSNVTLDADLNQFNLTGGDRRDLDESAPKFEPPRGELVSALNAAEAEKLIHMFIYELTSLSRRAPRRDDQLLDASDAVTDTADNQLTLDDTW